jgi:hypothetical protein
LNDLLGAKEPGESETLTELPKLKWQSSDAHPRTSPRTSPKRLRQLWKSWPYQSPFPKPVNVTRGMYERVRQDLTEEATPHETDRRAIPTEAGKVAVWKSKATKRFSAA